MNVADDSADRHPADPTGSGSEPAHGLVPRRRTSVGATVLVVLAFIVVAASALLAIIKVPYVVMSPGPVTDTLGSDRGVAHVKVVGARTYPTSGHLWFTTVNVLGGPQEHITGWEAVRAWADPASRLLPEDQVFPPGTTEKEVQQRNTDEMLGSQEAAIAVALRGTGHTVKEAAEVAAVTESSPARGRIRPGDVITAVDGRPVRTMGAAVTAIRERAVGDTVALSIAREDQRMTFPITTVDVQGRAAVGLLLQPKYTFPFTVTIDAGKVGGPSAGMMFSLAVRDLITPGSMTGGADIAGTGTISDDGTVGPIGGIEQKLVGARRAGATWFLAPAANCDEVRGHVPDGLQVVRVQTHAEAASAVERIGSGQGASLPGCG